MSDAAALNLADLSGPVILALLAVAALCFAAGYWLHAAKGRRGAGRTTPEHAGVPDEIIAVIAAAVAEVVDAPHRIVRVRGLTPDDLGWLLEGRMQHHTSHKPHH
jgi:hypothetical protein